VSGYISALGSTILAYVAQTTVAEDQEEAYNVSDQATPAMFTWDGYDADGNHW
jgi:hypothetical protein